MIKTIVKTRDAAGMPPLAIRKNDRRYQEAWRHFERLSARLRTLWKTRKTTLQIMRTK